MSFSISSKGGIVIFGVSRKVLEGLIKENTRLKSVLVYVIKRENGSDLVLENKDFYEIIKILRDDRDEKVKENEKLM